MQSQEIKIKPSTNLLIKLSSHNLDLILSDTKGNIIQYISEKFEEKVEPNKLSDKLDLVINKFEIINSNVIKVKLIVLNKLSALVPLNLFQEELSLEYLKFNSKLIKGDFAAHDLIDEIEAVNVFLPFVNVNNYLLEKFGSFNYYHYSTILIKKLIKYDSSKEVSIYANIQLNNFHIIILKNKKLIYYNIFDFNEKEDILYFLLFVLKQNKIDQNKHKLSLLGQIKKESETYLLLTKFINNIEILDIKEEINRKKLEKYSEIDYVII
tara:strand:- start:2501 stop:3301 length:801 start_codon:yes stop_codon:yes gene_type:complete